MVLRIGGDVTDKHAQWDAQLADIERRLEQQRHIPWWETAKGLAAIVAVLVVVIGLIGYSVGYQIARSPAQPLFPPGTTITVPSR